MSPAPTNYYLEVDDTCVEVPDYPLRAIETQSDPVAWGLYFAAFAAGVYFFGTILYTTMVAFNILLHQQRKGRY